MTATTIQAEAKALWERHAALLSTTRQVENTVACDALDAARLRLQGGERRDAGQLAMDLRPR